MHIAIASGKGGTGKTLVATNLAVALGRAAYVDCDVEGANGALFLDPHILETRPARSPIPKATDACTGCGACARACRFGALAALKTGPLVFAELCHACGACAAACPEGAIQWESHSLGTVRTGTWRAGLTRHMPFADGELATGQVRAAGVIAEVKRAVADAPFTVLDCPPGCSCAVAEALQGADVALLVTEPTPFGLSDLEKAVGLVEYLGIPHAVILNRSDLGGTDVAAFCRTRAIPVVMDLPYDARLARACAEGRLVYRAVRPHRKAFDALAQGLATHTLRLKRPVPAPDAIVAQEADQGPANERCIDIQRPPDLVQVAVVSGKGGTGKTSLTASLADSVGRLGVADADVDAANLHLLLKPKDETHLPFSGAYFATIDPDRCRGCGVCANECRFGAISLEPRAVVDPLRCEGCGLCALVCPLAGTEEMPVRIAPRLSGFAHDGTTATGALARGELLAGGEASGKLVTLVRQLAESRAGPDAVSWLLIDASPGTGCPVNAALTGTDLAVAVTEPSQSGLHDLQRVLDLAHWFNVPAVVVINKADVCPELADRIAHVAAQRGAELVGRVPFDRTVPEDLARGIVPVRGRGEGAKALADVCETLRRRVETLVQEKTAAAAAAGPKAEEKP